MKFFGYFNRRWAHNCGLRWSQTGQLSFKDGGAAILGQIPMTILMVLYTGLSFWLIAQTLKVEYG